MKIAPILAIVAVICYISLLEPVEAQNATTAAPPPKNKTCGKGWRKRKGMKRPTRAISVDANLGPGGGRASSSAFAGSQGKNGQPAVAMASAVANGGKKAMATAYDGAKKAVKAVSDGAEKGMKAGMDSIKGAKPEGSKAKPKAKGSASVSVGNAG